MAYFLDPEHWTIRGGPTAVRFGDPYICIAQGQVQGDRTLYLSGAVGPWQAPDVRGVIAEFQAIGRLYHWKEILWERHRDGLIRPVRFPIR